MKILYINNYACDISYYQKIKNFEFSANHYWGIYEIIGQGYKVDFILSSDAPSIKGKKNPINRFFLSLKKKIYRRKVLNKYRNYDIIYSAITGSIQMDYFAKLKLKNKIKSKLIAVLHHPENTLKYASAYNKIIFISTAVEKKFSYPNKEYIFWGPDLNYYNYWIDKLNKTKESEDIIFFSNGKSHRNHDEFLSAANELKAKATIICNNQTLPSKEYLSNDNFTIINSDSLKNPISSNKNIEITVQADIMVIPVKNNNVHLCGLTSFIDAIALGKPIIMSNNTFIDIDIEKEGFGFIYKAGDINDLKKQMQKFINNRDLVKIMGQKAKTFAYKNDFKNIFAKRIIEIIE